MGRALGAIDLVEACYELAGFEDWANRLCAIAANARYCGALSSSALRCDLAGAGDFTVTGAYRDELLDPEQINAALADALLHALHAEGPSLSRWLEGGRAVRSTAGLTRAERYLALAPTPPGTFDTLTLMAARGASRLLFCLALPERASARLIRSSALRSMNEHVEAGFRLASATALGEAAASFDPDGRCIEHSAQIDRAQRARLADAVRAMDRARCRRKRLSDEQAVGLWRAVVDGRYTLVESFERGGRRVVVAVPVAPLPGQGLSAMERRVAALASRGLANKAIAARLGISASTVNTHLAAALQKLRCGSRNDLMRSGFFAGLHGDEIEG